MPLANQRDVISTEEYLEGELTGDDKHELINGCMYAMAGASGNHGKISANIARKFGNHLEHSPCTTFVADMKVKVNSNFFYPDIVIDCDFDESEPYYTRSPKIIVEVLSDSTRRKDRTTKQINYFSISSLQEYVLIEQDFVDIEVAQRKNGWKSKHYLLGEEVTFASIGLTVPVAEIYHRVNNEDMLEFLVNREQAENIG